MEGVDTPADTPAAPTVAKPKKKKGGGKITAKDLVGLGEKRGTGAGGRVGVSSLGACSIQ
jgi:hypothetical protein